MLPSRTNRKLLLAIVALVLVGAGYFVLLPSRFDVPSIAATPQYQEPVLLERAWELPVARTFGRRVASQSNGSVCGPTSVANVLRSLGVVDASSAKTIEGSGLCRTGYCIPGVTLDELAVMAQKKTARKVVVVRDLSLDEFRAELRRTNDPSRRYIVNFQRGLLFGKGSGHHAPIAGYLEAEDLVLVLDVNAAFGPWLVSSERLFRAMDTVDGSSGKKRGLLVFE